MGAWVPRDPPRRRNPLHPEGGIFIIFKKAFRFPYLNHFSWVPGTSLGTPNPPLGGCLPDHLPKCLERSMWSVHPNPPHQQNTLPTASLTLPHPSCPLIHLRAPSYPLYCSLSHTGCRGHCPSTPTRRRWTSGSYTPEKCVFDGVSLMIVPHCDF